MATRADNKCGSCYKKLREGPTVYTDPRTTIKIVLCDNCWDIWDKGDDDILPVKPVTEGLNYGTNLLYYKG